MHTIERVARFHLEFDNINSFININGNTNRMLLTIELMQNRYPPINGKFRSKTILPLHLMCIMILANLDMDGGNIIGCILLNMTIP